MVKTLIIDDELKSRQALKMLLETFFSEEFDICDTCASVAEALKSIKLNQPQLVFLDMELKDKKGFELFDKLNGSFNFYVVVTTGHKKYAIESFKYGVFDYLLKPVANDDIELTLQRLKRAMAADKDRRLNHMVDNTLNELEINRRVMFPTKQGHAVERVSNILYCTADVNYTKINTLDNRQYTVAQTLKKFEEMLPASLFYRVHKSHLVNLNHVRLLSKKDDPFIEMTDGTKIKLSTRKVNFFTDLFN